MKGERMPIEPLLNTLIAERIAEKLIDRRQTLAVSESSTGGLISAALLSVPGASGFFLGSCVIYTRASWETLLGITPTMMTGIRSATEEMASLLALTVRARLGADWALAETGATGPSRNSYGDSPGHCCLAIAGPHALSRVIATGSADRKSNMHSFTSAALTLLEEALDGIP
jgi:nicotinamide-nucleotide amidase